MFVLRFVCFLNSNLNNKKDISEFTTGAIVGMMVIGDPQYYDPSLGKLDAWATGKIVYKILEVLRLPQECVQKSKGNLGTFYIDNDVEKKILDNPIVQETIVEWNGKYKSMLAAAYDVNEKRNENSEKNKSNYKAMAIKQPILEAIMDGFKKSENRSKAILALKGTQLKPREFKDTLCRFCPNNDPMSCHYILHVGLKRYNEWKAEQKLKMLNKKKNKERIKEKKAIGWKCNFPGCGSVFELRSELTRHGERIHQYPKPFECKVCYRKYASRTLLKKHLRSHVMPQYYEYSLRSRMHLLANNDSSIKNLCNVFQTMGKEYETNEYCNDKNSSVEIDISDSISNERKIEMMNVSRRAKAQYAAAQESSQR